MALLDVGQAVLGGTKAAESFERTKRQNEIRSLQQSIANQQLQGGFDPAQSQQISQLTGLDPVFAQNTISTFENLSQDRQRAFFQDAKKGLDLLNQGRVEDTMTLVDNRREEIIKLGGDTSDVDFIGDSLQSGQIEQARQSLQAAVQLGVDSELLPDPLDRQIKEAQLDTEKAKKRKPLFAPSDVEKNFNKITALRQQLSAAEKSGKSSAIKAAQQELNDFQQVSGKFGLGAQEKSDIRVLEAANKELSKQAAIASKDAFDGLKTVRSSIGNMTDAIRALNKGANTGPIISKLPSFRESSIELDNIRGKMGLDIVGATTFGALSESELAFALDVALPDKLDPESLKDWLNRKRDAQKKLGRELMRAATFLGKPGNTIAKYIERETQEGRLLFNVEDNIPTQGAAGNQQQIQSTQEFTSPSGIKFTVGG